MSPVDQIAREAANKALQRIEGHEDKPRSIRVPTTFTHRNSCGCTAPRADMPAAPER